MILLQVIADKAAHTGTSVAAAPPASIIEVAAATQDAVAKAVEKIGVNSHELTVMRLATKVLKEQEDARSPTGSSPGFDAGMATDTVRLPRVSSLSALPTLPMVAEDLI